MAARDDDAADEDRAGCAQESIGDPSAGHRRHVDEHRVGAIQRRRIDRRESQSSLRCGGDHEEHQDRSHPVVAESLPHLGEEQGGQAGRMSRPYFGIVADDDRGSGFKLHRRSCSHETQRALARRGCASDRRACGSASLVAVSLTPFLAEAIRADAARHQD
jgi:hypothetical protein